MAIRPPGGETAMTRIMRQDGEPSFSSSTATEPLARRSFLAAAATAAATAAVGHKLFARDYGPHSQPVRYPDPDIIALDKRFAKYKIGNTPIQRLYTGM